MDGPPEPADSYVESLWVNLLELEQLMPAHDATILVDTRSAYAKAMVLAAGNWLERRTLFALLTFARDASRRPALVSFVKIRTLDRQFHTLFNWRSGKVNSFLGTFGADFRDRVKKALQENEDILRASKDFMTLVADRNTLAHSSRLADEVDFTPLEVRNKFFNAASWVAWIGKFLVDGQEPSWDPPSIPIHTESG